MANRSSQISTRLGNVSVVYNIYRVVLPLVFLITYVSTPGNTIFGALDLNLFIQTCTVYATLGACITFVTSAYPRLGKNWKFLSASLILDVLALSVLIYSCGGVGSGLGVLLIVTVASASILVRGRMSAFLAAIATLSMIQTEIYLTLVIDNHVDQFVQAGLLGALLFATSLYVHWVTENLYTSALLADQQASNIMELEELNREIIQRMHTGIIVANPAMGIVTMNSAARGMLKPVLQTGSDGQLLNLLPQQIADLLRDWNRKRDTWQESFEIPESNTRINVSITPLSGRRDSDIIIFLENNSLFMQRVQQAKLAALGRLTASIAHEVRNPLGAISHAGQLLRESPAISKEDARMVDIILTHCKRVDNIIDHVLNASRFRDLTPTVLRAGDWLRSYVNTYMETHPRCGDINLIVENEATSLRVIASQLVQVLDNLIENGLRYSNKATGKATVTIQVCESEANGEIQPYLQIIDQGPPLSEAAHSLLFEPFYTTEPNGTGLGLYICKELCEANHCSLFYSVSPQGTSSFCIYFNNTNKTVT